MADSLKKNGIPYKVIPPGDQRKGYDKSGHNTALKNIFGNDNVYDTSKIERSGDKVHYNSDQLRDVIRQSKFSSQEPAKIEEPVKQPEVPKTQSLPDKAAQEITKQTSSSSSVEKQPEINYTTPGKTTETPSYKLYQSPEVLKSIKEQESGTQGHMMRSYVDKFGPHIKKDPKKKAQYEQEKLRKVEMHRHYKSSKYITGKREELPKTKG